MHVTPVTPELLATEITELVAARPGRVRLAVDGPSPAHPRALADAVGTFHPDRLVICTLPEDRSAWLRYDVVDRAREAYDLPVTHVVVEHTGLPVGAP